MEHEFHASDWRGGWPAAWVWAGAAALLVSSALMFGDVLLSTRPLILSAPGGDLTRQFVYWREFAAAHLRQGELPLWNPHVFSGTPFLGWSQTAPLYPWHWLDLILPMPLSINVGIALHFFLAGLFMFLWALRRRLHPLPAFVGATAFMFCGTYFVRVYPGHPTMLSTFAWAPLVFLCADGILWTGRRGWALLGMLAVAMQVLGGDPQCCFYTAVAAGLYFVAGLPQQAHRLKKVGVWIVVYLGAAALGAVQWLTSWQAAAESTRSSGVDLTYASSYALSVENLITLVAPGFFGDMITLPYWGRWYWWEEVFFIGVGALALAVYAVIASRDRWRWQLCLVAGALVILALGTQTPVFGWFYRWVPGFDRFRGPMRFAIPSSAFLAMLAGVGLHRLMRVTRTPRGFVLGLLTSAVTLGVLAGVIRMEALRETPGDLWSRAMQAVQHAGHTEMPSAAYKDKEFIERAGFFAARGLTISALILLVMAGILCLAHLFPRAVVCVALLVVLEVFAYARYARATVDFAATRFPPLETFLQGKPVDERFLMWKPNLAIALGRQDIWGYGPLALKRYAEFVRYSQGMLPDSPDVTGVTFRYFHPMLALVRCRYIFEPNLQRLVVVERTNILDHVQLVTNYRLLTERDRILEALADRSFDPRQQVILETAPIPAPADGSTHGTARVVDSRTDSLTVEVDTPAPAILLITDAYSRGWRVRSLGPAPQPSYTILPADYILRAIPLAAGHHLLKMEYRPRAFVIGAWISAIAWLGYVLVLLSRWRRLDKLRGNLVGKEDASPGGT